MRILLRHALSSLVRLRCSSRSGWEKNSRRRGGPFDYVHTCALPIAVSMREIALGDHLTDTDQASVRDRRPSPRRPHRGRAAGRCRAPAPEAILERGRQAPPRQPLRGPAPAQAAALRDRLWATGVVRVAGVDEAGMSPLAGPVAAAAVIFAPGTRIPGVDDSKKLDAAARERLAAEIKQTALAWRSASPKSTRSIRSTSTGPACWRMRRAVEALAAVGGAPADRRAAAQGRGAPAAAAS